MDGDLVESPDHCLGAGRSGEAAVVTVILAHVVLRQQVQQGERLDFCSLALIGDGGQLLGYVSKVDIVCVSNLQHGWESAWLKAEVFNGEWIFTDIDEDSKNGESCRVPQSSGEIRVDGFHVDHVHLEGDKVRLAPTCGWPASPRRPLLTVLYLHRVSASVHRVLGAVGGGAAPVEVQLGGVVDVWKAAASHRHAAPDLEDDWKTQNPRFIREQPAFRGFWEPNLRVHRNVRRSGGSRVLSGPPGSPPGAKSPGTGSCSCARPGRWASDALPVTGDRRGPGPPRRTDLRTEVDRRFPMTPTASKIPLY